MTNFDEILFKHKTGGKLIQTASDLWDHYPVWQGFVHNEDYSIGSVMRHKILHTCIDFQEHMASYSVI